MTNADTAGNGSSGWLGGALMALGSGIASIFDSRQRKKTADRNTDKTIAHQKAESELAYQRNKEMWNAQNMYNSPQAQMARYAEAGLNPHLIYGQGSSGNASSPPAYQPPDIQYRYEAGNYGAATYSMIPALMAAGSWMQDMKLKEANLQKISEGTELTQINQDKTRELVEFMRRNNPQLLQKAENELNLYPYQQTMQQQLAEKAWMTNRGLEEEYKYQWGKPVYEKYQSGKVSQVKGSGGMKEIQRTREIAKKQLDEAKASWTDYNITDPQSIIQMVLGGIMGLAGQQIKAGPKPKVAPKKQDLRKLGKY